MSLMPASNGFAKSKYRRDIVTNVLVLLLGVLIGRWLGGSGKPAIGCPLEAPEKAVSAPEHARALPAPSANGPDRRTVVLYSFFDGDAVSWGNLQYFVSEGIHPNDGIDYLIILNGMNSTADERLPTLPQNARFVVHKNECYDWGTYAWALENHVDSKNYHYFIFMNNSVRGPIVPWYARYTHWATFFTSKLNQEVKLVGPAISCEHFCVVSYNDVGERTDRQCRQNAHVQSVAIATDEAGLEVLQKAGYVLTCHADRNSAVFYGEIGASLAILNAGFTIDSFQTRYQGVDWHDPVNWNCNHAGTPIGKRTFDGTTLSPFELVFPKLKGSLLESGLPSHYEALKLSTWVTTQPSQRNITSNYYVTEGKEWHAEDVLVAQTKGENCFDWDYYKGKNTDVAFLPQKDMWKHFLTQGMTQFREHRWKCGLDVDTIIPNSHHS